MGIHKNGSYTPNPNARPHDLWACSCDACGTIAGRGAIDPGRADMLARRAGFTTSAGSLPGDPLVWLCRSCRPEAQAGAA